MQMLVLVGPQITKVVIGAGIIGEFVEDLLEPLDELSAEVVPAGAYTRA